MPGFAEVYDRYITKAMNARSENKVEQERKRLFFGFLQESFGLKYENYEIEKRVKLPEGARGYVDALFGDLVFEFKQDLDKGHQQIVDQLADYLNSDEMRRQNYIGVLTDGFRFEMYVREGQTLRELDRFELKPEQAAEAFERLDAYLFTQKAVRPTSSDIVFRFGATSPSFKLAFERLHALLIKTNYSALAVWREQWDKLLSKVYGDRVTGDEGNDLYIKHTYLCQFAKLLAYGALNSKAPKDAHEVESIIRGDAFIKDRVSNIGESDFFSWVLLDDIKAEALDIFRRLAAGLMVYDLKQIDQDLLKQLYQNLVDPSTRHDLGEYYTPDWLAELVLEDINYAEGQSLLDPACGSGSFLFAAIKRLEQNGLHGAQLIDFAANNIMGLDVHPLAVTIARLNYVLALSAALRTTDANRISLFPVPIYMADALQETGRDLFDKQSLVIPVREKESFSVPLNIARHASFYAEIIETMEQTAQSLARDKSKAETYSAAFVDYVKQRSEPIAAGLFDARDLLWSENVRLLARLIDEGRNGIWAYILKNQARPMMLAERKFDVIVGNPPWLTYKDIKNSEYQAQVKRLSIEYRLIASSDRKLVTQIELCTLFAVHAETHYLCEGGTMALVMPRSVITGAKQHRKFQAKGLTRVIDLLGVGPLFNVPSCVTIIQGGRTPAPVPSKVYSGRLPFHEMSLPDARGYLKEGRGQISFVDSDIRSLHYHPLFSKGASLVPRNLCLVAPEGDPASPMFITDPDADREAKKPYKGVKLRGRIDNDYLFATLLSKHLMPFGHEKLHLVALPVRLQKDGSLRLLPREFDFIGSGKMHFQSWQWFERATHQWDTLSKGGMTLFERWDYQKTLTNQRPLGGYRVIYNESGTHISACVMPPKLKTIHDRNPQALIVDDKTYYYAAQTAEEAHYLCALLNTPSVDVAIKAYQPRGIFKGERHISRTPFEACAIPPFEASNPIHQQLAAYSQSAHVRIAQGLAAGEIAGSVYRIRDQARAAVEAQLSEIDGLARDLLGL